MTKSISISKARKLLPSLVKELQEHPDITYLITVSDREVAELRPVKMIDKSGLAAQKLLELLKKKPNPKANEEKEEVSLNIKKYLYQKNVTPYPNI